MKKLLSLLLVLTLAALGSRAMADSDMMTIWVAKSSDSMAKVTTDKGTATMVPIMFDSGADWTDVKDSYSVSSCTLMGLEKKKVCMSVGADGTASFKKSCSTKGSLQEIDSEAWPLPNKGGAREINSDLSTEGSRERICIRRCHFKG